MGRTLASPSTSPSTSVALVTPTVVLADEGEDEDPSASVVPTMDVATLALALVGTPVELGEEDSPTNAMLASILVELESPIIASIHVDIDIDMLFSSL